MLREHRPTGRNHASWISRAVLRSVILTLAGHGVAAQEALPTAAVPTVEGQFSGTWSYRSFVNEPDLNAPRIAFGSGTLTLVENASHAVTGRIGGPGWELNITGTSAYSETTAQVTLEGRGTINGELWVYSYAGSMAPRWSNAVNQVDAIVGTVVRTVPHSGGAAEAGFTASFYAVRSP